MKNTESIYARYGGVFSEIYEETISPETSRYKVLYKKECKYRNSSITKETTYDYNQYDKVTNITEIIEGNTDKIIDNEYYNDNYNSLMSVTVNDGSGTRLYKKEYEVNGYGDITDNVK